ncbi:flagellar motor protein MotB [Paenibacillus wulumuqiensis]|uniref:flagellar motor protein MotB n=1 Tax=Paenibacillus wulumuqiensis TaxID=1567107 RepID=UPI000619F372|nr:flagellar motor protein MotB [Paenibacillus wulumuqiensis]
MSKKGKRHEPHEEHADESWLLPYSDLMTLLLALFITLFSMSSMDAAKFEQMAQALSAAFSGGTGVLNENAMAPTAGKVPNKEPQDSTAAAAAASPQDTSANSKQKLREQLKKQEQKDLEDLKRKLDKYIKENGLSTQLTTKLNQSELSITISDNTLFASGQATVKPDSRKLAKSLAAILQEIPNYDVIVSGHTDNVPISTSRYTSNWNLSSDRALNFMQIMLLNKNLNPRKFSAIGYGEYRPIDSNGNNVGRAKNRRVEVAIVRKYVDNDVKPTLQSVSDNNK